MKQYIKLFKMDGIELTFTEAALDYIVDKGVEYKLGARGLRSIVEAVMMDAMFDVPSRRIKSFEVTEDTFVNNLIRLIFRNRIQSHKTYIYSLLM